MCLALGLSLRPYFMWLTTCGRAIAERPTEQVKVDIIYAAENHFNEVEYSVGKQEMQTCLDALMPHFGYKPCWYLRRHTAPANR